MFCQSCKVKQKLCGFKFDIAEGIRFSHFHECCCGRDLKNASVINIQIFIIPIYRILYTGTWISLHFSFLSEHVTLYNSILLVLYRSKSTKSYLIGPGLSNFFLNQNMGTDLNTFCFVYFCSFV